MLAYFRKRISSFLQSDELFVTLTAIASGLYPLLHYYNSNYLMVNSWSQLIWFVTVFLLTPIVAFFLLFFLIKQFSVLKAYSRHVLIALNVFIFLGLMLFVTYGLTSRYILFIAIFAFLIMFILHKHYKKLVLIQLLMAFLSFVVFVPKLYKFYNYSDDWMALPDAIENAKFIEKPNIYVIQPDGYANFNELIEAPYAYDNSDFKGFLEAKKFKIYNNRSNYFSTLTSNASMFSMKHHHYIDDTGANETQYDYRKGLAGDNATIKTLKNNGYKTFMLLGFPYIIINRPKKEYDFINYDYSSMSYIGNKWEGKSPLNTLSNLIITNKDTNNFFFIEKILPTHIENLKSKSMGVEGERKAYLDRLERSNKWLKQVVETITTYDEKGIIIIVSDHGGYVGLESAEDLYTKIEDSKLKTSIFSSLLAVKWPNNIAPKFDNQLNSNVNLFRILFTYLSKNDSYLKNLQDDSSYMVIRKGAPTGVYEYIDDSGLPTFNEIN